LQVPRLSVENSLTVAFLKNGHLVDTVTSFGMRRIFPDWRFFLNGEKTGPSTKRRVGQTVIDGSTWFRFLQLGLI
jgi:hypothetical protein